MEHSRRPPSLNLQPSPPARPVSTSPSPLHRQSQSPFRYVQFTQHSSPQHDNEKETPLSDFAGSVAQQSTHAPPPVNNRPLRTPVNSQTRSSRAYDRPLTSSHSPLNFARHPAHLAVPIRSHPHVQRYTRPRGLRIANLIKPWIPFILYAFTSLAFVVAIALYRNEVFACLDELSHWLQQDEHYGHAVLFLLIFITTFPPIPLYSTLITLSGYTFGPWTGAIISYFAALSGALTVFIISRSFLRDSISRWLSATITIKRVVRAVEKRPKLLFLIRLAPYPYNVMNCLLAAAPTLTLRTYTICTALSLFKVIIHTSMGASIHSFKDYHVVNPPDDGMNAEPHEHTLAELWTALGIVLCIAILIYLSYVARKAVDDELDDGPITTLDTEETVSFLSNDDDLELGRGQPMAESPFRPQLHAVAPSQPATTSTVEHVNRSRT